MLERSFLRAGRDILVSVFCTCAFASSHALADADFTDHIGFLPDGPTITQDDIKAAQKAWGDAVVAIGKAGDKAPEVAAKAAQAAYSFTLGPIMFKPTLVAEHPFRPDLKGTLSYFVGGDPDYQEDKGFALRPWSAVRFDNHGVKIKGNIAIVMGEYYFTGPDKTETKVEFTKGYVKTPDNRVLIFLQDSSLPFDPEDD